MSAKYNAPPGTASSIGEQFNDHFYAKKALVELKKEMYFSPLADTTSMPKNFGKTIKQYHYIPLLDDQNINDQGLDAAGVAYAGGNLYGSSKDIGTIVGKFPALTEDGGRVNRVGFKRKTIEGSIAKYGIFREYTKESVDFDTDSELNMHVNREMLFGANEITEDMLQIDLINAAGVIKYPGAAVSIATVNASALTYKDFLNLHITLNDNRTPLRTKYIKGSVMTDTMTIPSGRIMYIGSELQPTIEAMVDFHGNPAFVPAHKYAAGGPLVNGEIGTLGYFRIIVVPEMLNYTGAGAVLGGNTTHYGDGTKFNVYPMLVVGDASFTTIGFQTDGKTIKFKIKHSKPESTESYSAQDPYGEKGFMSIKWYYGFMVLRPERIAVMFTAAAM